MSIQDVTFLYKLTLHYLFTSVRRVSAIFPVVYIVSFKCKALVLNVNKVIFKTNEHLFVFCINIHFHQSPLLMKHFIHDFTVPLNIQPLKVTQHIFQAALALSARRQPKKVSFYLMYAHILNSSLISDKRRQ